MAADASSGTARPLLAASYKHPALPGRTVVRLLDEALHGATDVEMGVLGFAEAAPAKAVGTTAPRALGFPAWALVHHPKNARFALDIMRDFRRAAGRIRTKPGHAKDAFVALAKELEAKAPMFLPSFWEEAGRAFVAEESTGMASVCFEKARASERTFGLSVDEDRRAEAYLEFSLAGAVPAKSFGGYAEDLMAAFGPTAGERRYRELHVARIRGGVPPMTGLAKELRKLAKIAKRDPLEADLDFLQAIADAPSLRRAPADFWEAYRPVLAATTAGPSSPFSPLLEAIRDRIVGLFPAFDGKSLHSGIFGWLDFLVALDAPKRLARGGPIHDWFGRLNRFVGALRGRQSAPLPPSYFALLEAAAPALAAAGTPVPMDAWTYWHAGSHSGRGYLMDAVDAALARGLLVEPSVEARFEPSGIARDPVHISADPRWAAALATTLEAGIGKEPFEKCVLGKPCLIRAREDYLLTLAKAVRVPGLLGARDALQNFVQKTSSAVTSPVRTVAATPAIREALAAIEGPEVLAATLRGGLFEEWTWPAFEKELNALGTGVGAAKLFGSSSFPTLVAGARVTVFVDAETVVRYDLPANIGDVQQALYVTASATGQSDLLIAHRPKGTYSTHFQWHSGGEPMEVNAYFYGPIRDVVTPQGVSFGGPILAPGERFEKWEIHGQYISNGVDRWLLTAGERIGCFPVDASLKKLGGRTEWPACFAAFAEQSDGASVRALSLSPARPGAEHSPVVGGPQGVGGMMRHKPVAGGGAFHYQRADGATFRGEFEFHALVDLPSGPTIPIRAMAANYHSDERYTLLDASGVAISAVGSGTTPSAGFPRLPRAASLQNLRSRDVGTSRALRATTAATAASFLAAAATDRAAVPARTVATERAIQEAFPGIDAVLLRAIAVQVFGTYEFIQRIDALCNPPPATEVEGAAAHAPHAASAGGPPIGDNALVAAMHLGRASVARSGGVNALGAYTRAALALANGSPPTAETLAISSYFPWEAIGEWLPQAVAFFLARPFPGGGAEGRDVLRAFAGALRATPVEGTFARLAVQAPSDAPWVKACPEGTLGYLLSSANIKGWESLAPRNVLVRLAGGVTTAGHRPATLFLRAGDGEVVLPPDAATGSVERVTFAAATPLLDAAIARREPVVVPTGKAGAAALAALVAGTSLEVADVRLLLTGLTNLGTWTHDFLGEAIRKVVDLKVADAKAAKERWKRFSARPDFLAFLAKCLPAAAAFGDDTAHLAAVRTAVQESYSSAISVPDGTVALVTKRLAWKGDVRLVLADFATGASRVGNFDEESVPGTTPEKPVFPAPETLASFAKVLALLSHEVGEDDPVRRGLPATFRRLRAALRDPRLLLTLPMIYLAEGAAKEQYLATFGGAPVTFRNAAGNEQTGREVDGLIVTEERWGVNRFFRPARLDGALRGTVAAAIGTESAYGTDPARAALFLTSPEALLLAEEIAASSPSLHLDPRVSAPAVVAAVQAKLGLSEASAVVYLVILAAATPPRKGLEGLVGGAARFDEAAEPLVAAGLLVTGTREKAGREHFLPGPWDAKWGPMETWKSGLYDRTFFGLALPLEPMGVLYKKAWDRILAGDLPRFEEAVREKKKR